MGVQGAGVKEVSSFCTRSVYVRRTSDLTFQLSHENKGIGARVRTAAISGNLNRPVLRMLIYGRPSSGDSSLRMSKLRR